MKPELAEHYFGALPLAVPNCIDSLSVALRGPATVMLFFAMEPVLPVSVLASRNLAFSSWNVAPKADGMIRQA